jgi:hypothetical protein
MLKTLGATLALAIIAVTASQAVALTPRYVSGHIVVHCPPPHGYARTCV